MTLKKFIITWGFGIITTVSLVFAIYAYFANREKVSLSYAKKSSVYIGTNNSDFPDVSLRWKKKPISSATMDTLVVWNSGNKEISMDIISKDKPLSLSIDQKINVFDVKIKPNRKDLQVSYTYIDNVACGQYTTYHGESPFSTNKHDKCSIRISIINDDVFLPNDGFEAIIYSDRPDDVDWYPSAKFKVPSKGVFHATPSVHFSVSLNKIIAIFAIIVIISLSLIVAVSIDDFIDNFLKQKLPSIHTYYQYRFLLFYACLFVFLMVFVFIDFSTLYQVKIPNWTHM